MTMLLRVKPSICHQAVHSLPDFISICCFLPLLHTSSCCHWSSTVLLTLLCRTQEYVDKRLSKPCLPASAQTDTANPAPSMREQPPHINNLLFMLKTKNERLHSLLAFPQDKLTEKEGSVHGMCMLVSARNLKPSREWRDWRKQHLCDGPPVLIMLFSLLLYRQAFVQLHARCAFFA